MSWIHYPLCFRLLGPLHVGYRKVGNLMQTRPYVPGKPLWAALTARLTRDYRSNPGPQDYRAVGKAVKENFRFGYLWPSLDGENPCFPWDHEAFDYTFLGSYISTALDYGRAAAEEGSLHEVEFLAPCTRQGQRVFLVGDLWVREPFADGEAPLIQWREALKGIQLGGERSYGWGRVRLLSRFERGRKDRGRTVTGFHWNTWNDEVVLELPAGSRLPAHVLATGDKAISEDHIEGKVEVVVGWERDVSGTRVWRITPDVRIAYAPGARLKGSERLCVEPWGYLRMPSGNAP